jgi:hypothetical protein
VAFEVRNHQWVLICYANQIYPKPSLVISLVLIEVLTCGLGVGENKFGLSWTTLFTVSCFIIHQAPVWHELQDGKVPTSQICVCFYFSYWLITVRIFKHHLIHYSLICGMLEMFSKVTLQTLAQKNVGSRLWGQSRGPSVRRPRSEEPHRRELKYYNKIWIKSICTNNYNFNFTFIHTKIDYTDFF